MTDAFRHQATVAIQRSMAHCRWSVVDIKDHLHELRFMCSGCLDRVLIEDY